MRIRLSGATLKDPVIVNELIASVSAENITEHAEV